MIPSDNITPLATIFLVVSLMLTGCSVNYPAQNTAAMVKDRQAPDRYCTLFCLRQAGYAGQGRIHTLKIDDRSIGALTSDNYYRIELWPGRYTFTVHLPEETFLGVTNRALSISKPIILKPWDAGHVFVLHYTDGMDTSSFAFSPVAAVEQLIAGRNLAGSIGLHDTAKVVELFDAVYDGPSRHGKAHGLGTLTWPDGCIYQGLFEYGEPTTQGRFFFPRGEYFRGLFRKGRPYRSGLLFAHNGAIIFAGRFMDEKPHGHGIRLGNDGPEFCMYRQGIDITRTVQQQAQEALDKLEAEQVEALLAPVKSIKIQLSGKKADFARLQKNCLNSAAEAEPLFRRLKSIKTDIAALEEILNDRLHQISSEQQALMADFPRTRYARELGMRNQIKAQLNQAIARERKWCQSEFARDRRWCQCAPFADDYLYWKDCLPQ